MIALLIKIKIFLSRRISNTEFGKSLIEKYISYKLDRIEREGDLRIVIGASGKVPDGWIGTEYPYVDVSNASTFERYFRKNTVSAFLAEHVWEHLDEQQARNACANCFAALQAGGYLRIAVPDGYHPDPDYIEYVRPGGTGAGSDDHRVLYTHETLRRLLEQAGFRVKFLEWFDENGRFHFEEWDTTTGFIERSTRFDDRNSENPTAYTSLIIDAFKP